MTNLELRRLGYNLDSVGKDKKAETTIKDGMGWLHDGYYCNKDICKACPYWTTDVNGNMACYSEEYRECNCR